MPRQSDLRYTFVTASDSALDVVAFTLKEGLSQPFELDVELSCDNPDVDFAEVLDQPALFTLWRGAQPVRWVHGLVSQFEQDTIGFRRTRYRAVVTPTLARAGLRSNWRIFQLQSAPQIIDAMLKAQSLTDYEQRLSQSHETREYCVQADETDLAFLARLAAEEGLLYSFEHRADGHRLIYTDQIQSLGAIGSKDQCSVLFQGTTGGDPAAPALHRLNLNEQVRTARQVQRDYSFKNPRYTQQHSAQGVALEHQGTGYERFDYPGRYKRDEVGKPFTRTRLTALRSDARVVTVEGDDARLQPGLAFDLVDHPHVAHNTRWRAIFIEHHGTQYTSQEEDSAGSEHGTTYHQTAKLIASDADWKAPLPAKPQMDGAQVATVVGPPGEEIYTDEWARIKVSFPWDRYSQGNEHSSCWMRVSQGWAGTTWGSMAIPRVGQEVIVQFMDGDPDQPMVCGRAYRADNLPPYSLPQHKTRMTIKSQTHKGEGFNELRFEDEKDQEEIYVHAQKDQNIHVNHDETTFIGHDRSETVDHDEQITIGNDRTEQVGNDETVHVLRDRRHEVGQDDALNVARNRTLQVDKDLNETVGNNRRDSITANHWSNTGGHVKQVVQGHHHITAKQAIKQTTPQYHLKTTEQVLMGGPAGSIRIDAGGITFQGNKILLLGLVKGIPEGSGNLLELSSLVVAGDVMDDLCGKRADGTCPNLPCHCKQGGGA
jgi:type VI secretion system secreted protein VgrG